MSYQLGLARRFLEAAPEANRGHAFGLLTTGLMTLQGWAMAAAGALANTLAPGTVIAVAGAASTVTVLILRPTLRPTRHRIERRIKLGERPGSA